MKRLRAVLLGLALPAVLLLTWQLVTTYTDVPRSILPDPPSVWEAFLRMVGKGQLQQDLGVSLMRVVKGFLAAAFLGMTAGTLMGGSCIVRELLGPLLNTLRQIPMIAWTPLVILWCGIGEKSKVVMIVVAAFFPILLNTMNGVAGTPHAYREVASLYRLGRWRTFLRVICPHALPHILVGLKMGLGISWMSLIAAELIAGTSGIGYRMQNARSLLHSDEVLVCMILIGLVGVAMDKCLGLLFRVLTPWERTGGGSHG